MQRFPSPEMAVASAVAAQQTEGLAMSPEGVALALSVARGEVSPAAAAESLKRRYAQAPEAGSGGRRRMAAAAR